MIYASLYAACLYALYHPLVYPYTVYSLTLFDYSCGLQRDSNFSNRTVYVITNFVKKKFCEKIRRLRVAKLLS